MVLVYSPCSHDTVLVDTPSSTPERAAPRRSKAKVTLHNCDTCSSRNPLVHKRILYTYSCFSVSHHRVDTCNLQGYLFSKKICRAILKHSQQIFYRCKRSSVLSGFAVFLVHLTELSVPVISLPVLIPQSVFFLPLPTHAFGFSFLIRSLLVLHNTFSCLILS